MTTLTAKTNLLGLTQQEMEKFFDSIGEKRFRAAQVMKWIHHLGVDDFDAILPNARKLVGRLDEEPNLNPSTGTMEFSLRDPDGYHVTVSALEPG